MVLLLGPSAQFRPVIARRLLLESFFSDLAAYRSGAEDRVPVQRDDQWFPAIPLRPPCVAGCSTPHR